MKVVWYVAIGVVACSFIGSVLRAPAPMVVVDQKNVAQQRTVPRFVSADNDAVEVQLPANEALVYSIGATDDWKDVPASGRILIDGPDHKMTEHLVSIPTAVAWLHPTFGQPSAIVIRVAEKLGNGRIGTPHMATKLVTDHHGLPVISILVPEGALFDPDTGIYVSGNAVIHPSPDMVATHLEDNRWWKYPGNYHFRGKEWQRTGRMQMLNGDGSEVFETQIGLRINGQLTRGFPIHALRLMFETPLEVPVFNDGDGIGSTVLLLRSAGNDQMKAMLRDALAHELCKDQPFDISRMRTCVVYMNGAYWGVHQLRQKVEEEELARRIGVKKKQIAMLEVRNNELLGKSKEAERFKNELERILALDPKAPDYGEKINEVLDLNGFLSYMAAVTILDNKDWPDANIKFWRYSDKVKGKDKMDGRWYFIFADMDLGLGVYGEPDAPLFERLKGRTTQMPILFNACMRSPVLQEVFKAKVDSMLSGPLSAERATVVLDAVVARMEPEMPMHIARWRKPNDMGAWKFEVERVRAYLRSRPEQVHSQLPELFR